MSFEPEEVLRSTESDIPAAVHILTAAFRDDPLVEYLFPENDRRLQQLDSFFKINVEFGLASGEVYNTVSMSGCAIWVFPGDKSRIRLDRSQFPVSRCKGILDDSALHRLMDFTECMKERHVGITSGSFCLLMFLAVQEKQRRKGVGSRLIQPVLKYSDDNKLLCILDTMNEKNLPFYFMHGFIIDQQYKACGSSPATWTMIRYPQG